MASSDEDEKLRFDLEILPRGRNGLEKTRKRLQQDKKSEDE